MGTSPQMSSVQSVVPDTEHCPWCDSVISRKKFEAIQTRIREQERAKLAQLEAQTKERLSAQFEQRIRSHVEIAEKRVQEASAEAAKFAAKAAEDRDKARAELKASQDRELEIRKQAEQKAQEQLKAVREGHEKELDRAREVLSKEKDAAVFKEKATIAREREGLQKKILELERRVQRRSAQDLGEGAEIDLYETLRGEFTTDEITRVPRGQEGADILHRVRYKGQPCGSILIDSKNHQSWRNTFVTKLREDQLDAKADHAILSTTVFPAGKKELSIESDVIVVNPARVSHVVRLLRRSMVTMHVRGLSIEERAGKMTKLYAFITSDAYRQRFAELRNLAERVLELDVQEKKAHDSVWKKRGALTTQLKDIHLDIEVEIDAVIQGGDKL